VYQEEYLTPKKSTNNTLDSTPVNVNSTPKDVRQKMMVVSAVKHKLFSYVNNEILNDKEFDGVLNENIEHQSYLQRFFHYICPAAVDYNEPYGSCMQYYNAEDAEVFWRKECHSDRKLHVANPISRHHQPGDAMKSPIEKISFTIYEGAEGAEEIFHEFDK
jgi:hypothetical protein